ncbi:hypothetical protein PALB_24360 [Pseudoalteromonas luteoviolacea B = ATCC 29581]|nr:hypothetical protein PALB_24360 [Pseudoalteromonas luteoviolacea B = ATCC 29581]
MAPKAKQKSQGFTLITVMLLTTMASVVVFAALKESIVQERLSGNFQKDLNARLLSEKGIFNHAETIRNGIAASNPTNIDAVLNQYGRLSGMGNIESDATFSTQLVKTLNNELEIQSKGVRFNGDANASMIARFRFEPAVYESVFGTAVTGCKGVNLSGSGQVDSYDSSKGTYEETKTNDGDVNTVIGDSDVVLAGHSPIKGDVQASGVIYLKGSSPVIGNIHSNTGVEISPGNGERVVGNVLTRGFFMHKGGSVTGYVRANGDATMKWGSRILNDGNDAFAIQYGGKGTFPDTFTHSQGGVPYTHSRFNVNPNVAPVKVYDPSSPDYDPKKPDKECDPLELPLNMPQVMENSSVFTPFSTGPTQHYVFTPSLGVFSKNGAGNRVAKQQTIYVLTNVTQNQGSTNNGKQLAFGLKGVSLTSDSEVFIRGGDVIWLVDGDMKMSGNTRLHIAKESSLTIFITGKVDIGASAKVITEKEGITASGFPSLSFYSSNKDASGFVFSGATDLYAAIYAPLTDVIMKGSGQLYGTVRGASINGSGGSGVHFDAALKNLKIGGSTNLKQGAKLMFLGWRYPS